MMDVYHAEFRETIVVDERIKKVSKLVAIQSWGYTAQEQFYLEVARAAGLNGWELDRLLYNFMGEILPLLQAD